MFNEYQTEALKTATPKVVEMGLNYTLPEIVDEIGEICTKLWFEETDLKALTLEIGDVFWPCAVTCRWLDLDFSEAIRVPELIIDIFDTDTVLKMLSVSGAKLMGILKKIGRDGGLTDAKKQTIIDIIGDITYDLLHLCKKFKLDPQEVLNANLTKLTSRKSRNVIQGDGDYR